MDNDQDLKEFSDEFIKPYRQGAGPKIKTKAVPRKSAAVLRRRKKNKLAAANRRRSR